MEITDALTIIAILVTAWAVIYEVEKARKLSRKTTAIDLLNDNCRDEPWLKCLSHLIDIKMNKSEVFDWRDFARRKFTVSVELDAGEQNISDAVRNVLNHYEFLAIAVLTETANEDIVRANLGGLFVIIYDELHDYINEARKLVNDPSIYINYESIVNRWKNSPETIGPID